MSKVINLTSQKWNDIIFENKPKDYGAYELRQSSSRRHIWAFIITVLLVALVSLLPMIMEKVASLRSAEGLDGEIVLVDIQTLDDEIEKQNEIIKEAAPPPPPLKSTIQYVIPEIVADEEITEDDPLLKSQDEIMQSDAQVSIFDVEGDDDDFGIDKADLEVHIEAAAEVVEEKIYDYVQQMPSFPGGEKELMKFLNDNIDYPMIAAENGIQGKVTVRFTIDKDGSITNVSVLSSPDRSLSEEAVRVVKSMPKWIPGKQNGVAVRVNFSLPVSFTLQ